MIHQTVFLKLHDDFTKESETFLKVFSDWSKSHPWSAILFPVYYWREVLYVIGDPASTKLDSLEKEKNIKIVFLVASEKLKKQLWSIALNHDQTQSQKLAESEPTPIANNATSVTPILTAIESSINKADTLGKKLIEIITPDFAKEHLEKLKTFYDKSLLLIQHNGFARPIAATENVNLETAINSQITTSEPNPIYIAYRTKKPFHGYLVANTHTKNFLLNVLEEKESVENLTVIPLTLEDEVIGYQVSFGQKSTFCDEALQHCLATAQELMAEVVMMIETKKSA